MGAIPEPNSQKLDEHTSPTIPAQAPARVAKLSEVSLRHHELFAPRLLKGGSEGERLASLRTKPTIPAQAPARVPKLSEMSLRHHELFAPRLLQDGSDGEWLASFRGKNQRLSK